MHCYLRKSLWGVCSKKEIKGSSSANDCLSVHCKDEKVSISAIWGLTPRPFSEEKALFQSGKRGCGSGRGVALGSQSLDIFVYSK